MDGESAGDVGHLAGIFHPWQAHQLAGVSGRMSWQIKDAYMRNWSLKAVSVALLGACAGPVPAAIDRALVTGGTVQGVVLGDVASFNGVPFAAPPVGPLRWKSPQPVIPWKGVKHANAFALPCAQNSTAYPRSSEDCLYLNIWTAANSNTERRAVMVWIHGGSLNSGGTVSADFDGTHFAQAGVVLVSIAYRLGAFGFLAHPDLSRESGHGSGAYGLEDQIAALVWVKENIAQFGGDPRQVTVFGESAGGMAVSLLVGAPAARDLFQRAISQSGGVFELPTTRARPAGPLRSLEVAEDLGREFLQDLGATNLKVARSLPVERILRAASGRPLKFWAVLDGHVLPKPNVESYRTQRFNAVPVLIGWNSGDGAEYGWNTWTWACLHAANAHSKVFVYYFDVRTPDSPQSAPHYAEVPFVFGSPRARVRPEDAQVSDLMRRYWVNFARNGDPNGPELPPWPAFEEKSQQAMVFDSVSSARPIYRDRHAGGFVPTLEIH